MKNKKLFYGLWLGLFFLVIFSYRNHFDNDFHFDDGHTIQNNVYIRSLKNIPKFFIKGAETFSSLPANQLYRPVVSTAIAFDYWLSTTFTKDGYGYNTYYYHLPMFIEYLLMLFLFYLVVVKVFEKSLKNKWNKWTALFATAWFGIHTVNGETLNYIISMSDMLSSLFVLAAFALFLYFPRKRRYGLFMIPFALGMLTKLTAAMFGPLLVIYYFLFEMDERLQLADSKVAKRKITKRLILQMIALAIFTGLGIVFVISSQSDTYTTGGSSRYLYLITQPFVVFHYFISFFIPYNLSADTDWGLLSGVFDIRFFIGMAFIIVMLWIALICYKKSKYRPITFGILWFFVTLAPTSSLIPLAEVMNDHRMMYPFIGLMIAVVWSLYLIFNHFEEQILNSYWAKNVIITIIGVILIGHSFGVMHRVEVWDNGKTLWYDVTQKSPKNGRGLMNYGLQIMGEGKYEQALDYYKRALEFMPYYNYLYTNIAIVYNAMDSLEKAEWYYKKSISLNPTSHNGYYYYGIFLREKKRYAEAIEQFKKVVELSPQFIYARYALMELYMNENKWDKFTNLVGQTKQMFPDDVTVNYYEKIITEKENHALDLEKEALETSDIAKLTELSLIYYHQSNFQKCIEICKKIIEKDPDNITAFNNLIAALNNLGNYSEALVFGEKAKKIEGAGQLLYNNIAVSERRNSLKNQLDETKTAEQWIALSLQFYQEGMYQSCVDACQHALKIKPNHAIAYNNICSAYNAMEEWQKAEEAGVKAVELDPESQLAKNNLALAQKHLNQ